MGPFSQTFYYRGPSSKVDKLKLQVSNGGIEEGAKDLYSDEALTKKAGTVYFKTKKLGNKPGVPILNVETTLITPEGSFRYEYIRDNYQKITVNTRATSGIFTAGTVTRKYKADKLFHRVRKLIYKSNK